MSEALYATVPLHKGLTVIDAVSSRRAAAILHFDVDDPIRCLDEFPDGDKVFDLREQIMMQQMAWGSRLIHGHIMYSEPAMRHFGTQYKLVTMLRDPVDRVFSNYRMNVREGVIKDDLDSYLDSPLARNHAQVFLRFLTACNTIPEPEVATRTQLAIERLKEFEVIGFLEDVDGFERAFAQSFGPRPRVKAYNQAPNRRPDIAPEHRARIQALCTADTAIYEAAKALQSRTGSAG